MSRNQGENDLGHKILLVGPTYVFGPPRSQVLSTELSP